MTRIDAEACKLTPCWNPLGAATGRSQASAPVLGASPGPVCSPFADSASDAARCVGSQGVGPTKSAGPAGGQVAMALASRAAAASQCVLSLLDTLDTTRRPQGRSAQHVAFVQELGPLTRSHRLGRAARLRQQARRRRAQLRNAGATESEVVERSKWHEARARGHEERIERVLACGTEVLVITCQACGRAHERTQGCRAQRFCVHCRSMMGRELRAKFLAARNAVLDEAAQRGLLNPSRRGGLFGDKFLTLTTAHLSTDTVATRIERVLTSWSVFLRRLNDYFRERDIKSAEWFRVLEWTEGRSDDLGHPHLHVWLFSPYLTKALLVDFWRAALLASGCPPSACTTPVVDIRAMTNPAGGAAELIKYLTKDITANGDKVPAALYAQVIIALDDHRQTQASRGFMARAKRVSPCCEECDSPLPKRVRRKKALESPPGGTE